jgi:hypothetical protein
MPASCRSSVALWRNLAEILQSLASPLKEEKVWLAVVAGPVIGWPSRGPPEPRFKTIKNCARTQHTNCCALGGSHRGATASRLRSDALENLRASHPYYAAVRGDVRRDSSCGNGRRAVAYVDQPVIRPSDAVQRFDPSAVSDNPRRPSVSRVCEATFALTAASMFVFVLVPAETRADVQHPTPLISSPLVFRLIQHS